MGPQDTYVVKMEHLVTSRCAGSLYPLDETCREERREDATPAAGTPARLIAARARNRLGPARDRAPAFVLLGTCGTPAQIGAGASEHGGQPHTPPVQPKILRARGSAGR